MTVDKRKAIAAAVIGGALAVGSLDKGESQPEPTTPVVEVVEVEGKGPADAKVTGVGTTP